ncbi:MAG: oligopeptide/dipeptide transporter, ATPase subunit [Dehalococcoidales bacterium]|nr:oligopeptide/dipeptide transporter, ATPase subunit [Dehalococcoidales bacterium]
MNNDLVEVKNLKMYFPIFSGLLLPKKVGEIKAVDGVSFSIRRGETLGLVGESGSGKTTTGLCLLQLNRPTAGEVLYEGKNLGQMKGEQLRLMRRKMQMIFQDPYGSLSPRMTAADIITEPLQIHHLIPRTDYGKRVEELFSLVDLNPYLANRYPHEFSAGERQRVGIARALAVNPEFIVCDEPVSALDVSVQAQIVCLLEDLQSRLNLTYLFIAHDLAVVGHISSRIAVMYLGKICELGQRDQIYQNPLHPYTRALLSAVPIPDRTAEKARQRIVLAGDMPSALNPPAGCNFHPRCPLAIPTCGETAPPLEMKDAEHLVACWRA